MTIYQSRYGANAEVGRNPSRKPVKDQSAALTLGGAGLGAAGYGAYSYGRYMPKRSDLLLRQAESRLGTAQLDVDRAVQQKKAVKELRSKLANASRSRDVARRRFDRVGATSKLVRRAGLGALAAGVGLTLGSAYATERKRGTFGYKRPNYSNTQGM